MSGCLESVTSRRNTERKSQIELFKKEDPHLILSKDTKWMDIAT